MDKKNEVVSTEKGANKSVNGYDIIVTIRPSCDTQAQAPSRPDFPLETVQTLLAGHLDELEIIEESEGILIKPKRYLGREKFVVIAAITDKFGGQYITADKDSCFLILVS